MKWHGARLYGVHRTCAETAAASCRITCDRSESARERRIALNKSNQHHHHQNGIIASNNLVTPSSCFVFWLRFIFIFPAVVLRRCDEPIFYYCDFFLIFLKLSLGHSLDQLIKLFPKREFDVGLLLHTDELVITLLVILPWWALEHSLYCSRTVYH